MDFNSVEIKKLIEYAYYLHKNEMEYYCKYDNGKRSDGVQYVPICEDNITGYPTKKLEGGIVCGYYTKEYGHSSAIPSLTLDVVIGTYIENGFIYDTAIRLHLDGSLSNKTLDERKLYYLLYKVDLEGCMQEEFPIIRGGKKHSIFGYDDNIPRLVIWGGYGDFGDNDNVFDQKSDNEKQELFIKVMVTLGFRKEDIIALLNGQMTAEDVFKNVAPENIVHTKVLYWNCRKYTFEDNTLIDIMPMDIEVSADIGQCLDDIPFPFNGPAIIDAALVNTYAVDFGENAKGHRLINVNSKKYSIYEANLTNAIIDEVIDLAKVDATETKFGHQVIANLDSAIGDLSRTRFSYAVDTQNQRFAVDCYGFLLSAGKRDSAIALSQNRVAVLSEASSYEAAVQGLNNGAQGIGLVRTEDMLRINGKAIYENIFITKDEDERNKLINLCYEILKEKMTQILCAARGKKVVFRLLDAKLGEILPQEQIDTYFYSEQDLRGSAALFKYPAVLESQVRAILTSALKAKAKAYVLVPMNDSPYIIKNVREVFQKVSAELGYYDYEIGAMIEYVWFANRANIIAKDADFISFGLNDLTESVTGLPRKSNDKCFAILDERVKRLIKESIYRAHLVKPDIPIGFCGLHTNFAENLPFFKELGESYITCNSEFVSFAQNFLSEDISKADEYSKLCLVLRKIRDKKRGKK